MRPRLIRAWAALLTAACGSSSGSGLFSGGHGDQPVIGAEAGTDPGSGGKVVAGGGGNAPAAGGGVAHSTGGTAPKAGGAPGNGGISAAPNAGGTAGGGAGGDGTGGSTVSSETGGAASNAAGGSAGEGAGGKMGNGGSAAVATPHSVACGDAPCRVGSALTSACCVSPVPLATVCIPTLGAGCANGGAAVTCDDAADCAPGEVCCGDSVGVLPITVCGRDCKDGMDQLCRTDDECKRGGGCEPIDAQPDYSHCK